MGIERFFVSPASPLREVMTCIDKNVKGIALVVDKESHLITTITDGDIRRAILAGIDLDSPVSALVERKKDTLYPKPLTARLNTHRSTLIQMMKKHSVRHIPLLDDEGCVAGLVTADEMVPQEAAVLEAVIMAGGFGTRLRPLTEDLPKPMLPVGDRPLLELIIEQLREAGIHQVNITTHYKEEKIEEYFGDGRQFGVALNYVKEGEPLGTAGALGLMKAPQEPFLVINGDILTAVNFRAMLAYHRELDADLTVAVRRYELNVPYGVIESDGSHVRRFSEKPTYSFFVNAGIYLLQPSVYQYMPNKPRFDMTDLIESLLGAARSVVSFPIVEYWLDIGKHADYQKAREDYEKGECA